MIKTVPEERLATSRLRRKNNNNNNKKKQGLEERLATPRLRRKFLRSSPLPPPEIKGGRTSGSSAPLAPTRLDYAPMQGCL